jgi:cysteine desulfurase
MMRGVYLDHHATTPLDPRALEAMLPYLTGEFGKRRVYPQLACAPGGEDRPRSRAYPRPPEKSSSPPAQPRPLALMGAARAARRQGRGAHLVTTALEHNSVSDTMRALADEGFSVTEVAPEPDGIVREDAIERAIQPGTVLVSMIAANAEIGTVQPVAEVGAICRARGVVFTPTPQLVGKLPVDVGAMGSTCSP